jgi:hypothetical protein
MTKVIEENDLLHCLQDKPIGSFMQKMKRLHSPEPSVLGNRAPVKVNEFIKLLLSTILTGLKERLL